MLLEVDGKLAVMIKNKKILRTNDNQEIERIEIYTYDIDNIIKTFTGDIKNKKDFLQLIYPLICSHILLNQYRNKNFVFTICTQPKPLDYEHYFYSEECSSLFSFKSNGDFRNGNVRVLQFVWNMIDEIREDDYDEFIKDVYLIILSQEEKFTREILNSIDVMKLTEDNYKTYKEDICVICINNKSNVLFCNCGHQCICSTCFQKIVTDYEDEKLEDFKTTCMLCKKENNIIRVLNTNEEEQENIEIEPIESRLTKRRNSI